MTAAPASTTVAKPRQHGKRKLADPRTKVTHERWNAAEYAALTAAAAQAGLPVGGYIRSLVLGAPGPRSRRQPRADAAALARLLGEVGKVGSNLTQLGSHINELARRANTRGEIPEAAALAALIGPVREMRDALMQALAREG